LKQRRRRKNHLKLVPVSTTPMCERIIVFLAYLAVVIGLGAFWYYIGASMS